MKLILKYTRGKDRAILLGILFILLFQVIFETAVPQQMTNITNILSTDHAAFKTILSQGMIMAVYALLAFITALLANCLIAILSSSVTRLLRKALFEKVMSFSLEEAFAFGAGSLINRCTVDMEVIRQFLCESLLPMVEAPLLCTVIICKISRVHIIWTLLLIAASLIIFGLVIFIFLSAMPLVKEGSLLGDKMSTIIREHVLGIREIHANNAQELQQEQFRRSSNSYTDVRIRIFRKVAAFSPTITAIMYSLLTAVYVSGAMICASGGESEKMLIYSSLVSFGSYITMMMLAFANIIMVILMLPSFLNAGHRVEKVLDTAVSIADGSLKDADIKEEGTIEFRHVSYHYPGAQGNVLEDIDFKVDKGQTLAIIGGTGSGKSTIMNMVVRLFDASRGQVLVDGIDVKDFPLKSLRNRIGYVPQKSFLFKGSIADNISFGENGKEKSPFEEVVRAARLGQADEFICKKAGQYQAEVKSGGSNFSGGQKQRMTIARSICRKPEIILFDDSFSALDYKTDRILRSRLKEAAGNMTVVLVSQRIGTVKNADKILVLDKGKIAGQGSHKELLENCRVYQEIVESQLSGEGAF